ncbi:nip7 [Ecytonucleospora hepatopenaei]|uniref:60S ribosome subunit biogenesis protein NIP7 n=1 Tax=Ecytonucleospora hepatopenaei TaxID=646526 RepID=A0A1W0E5P2_9MICR|nr:nip7 [Ecytonucleospora hepatopenaei]
MREITLEEQEKIFKKLRIYIGDNIEHVLKNKKLLLNNMRVFICSETLLKACSQIGRKQLVSAGIILGKFTKTDNFKITITGVEYLSKHGLHKVILADNGEMNFLYGNNALKSHVHKVSENILINEGVFVYNKNQLLLGFGLMAINQNSYQKARTGDIVVLNQADNGEYIRNETSLS